MTGLLDLPPEILSIVTGFLDLIASELLLLTGSQLLRTKLKRGGLVRIAYSGTVPGGWLAMAAPSQLTLHEDCKCSVDFMSPDSLIQAIDFTAVIHSNEWHTRLFLKSFHNLSFLRLSIPGGDACCIPRLMHSRIVLSDSMPNLLHFHLFRLSGHATLSNLALQYLIGTLPVHLTTFEIQSSEGPAHLFSDEMICAFPPSLRHLHMNVLFPGSTKHFRTDSTKLASLASELNLRFAAEGPKFGLPMHRVFPSSLETMTVQFCLSATQTHISMDQIISDLPRHLTCLSLLGSCQRISSSLFPQSLTRLTLSDAPVTWSSGSLPNLKELNTETFPTIALPSLQNLCLLYDTFLESEVLLPPLREIDFRLCVTTLEDPWIQQWMCSSPQREALQRFHFQNSLPFIFPPFLTQLAITDRFICNEALWTLLPRTLTELSLRGVNALDGPPFLDFCKKSRRLKSLSIHGGPRNRPRYLGRDQIQVKPITDDWLARCLEFLPKSLTNLELEFWREDTSPLSDEIRFPSKIRSLLFSTCYISLSNLLKMDLPVLEQISLAGIVMSDTRSFLDLPKLFAKFPQIPLQSMLFLVPTNILKAYASFCNGTRFYASSSVLAALPSESDFYLIQPLLRHLGLGDIASEKVTSGFGLI